METFITRPGAKRLLACLQRREMSIVARNGKFSVTPAAKITPDIRRALIELRADVLAELEYRSSKLAQLPPNAPGIPYREWERNQPIRDDRPEWTKAASERRRNRDGLIEKPAGPCWACDGTTYRLTASGLWICAACRPDFPKAYIIQTIEVKHAIAS